MQHHMRIFLCLLLVLVMFGAFVPAMASEVEPDITDHEVTENLSAETDVRWYRFEVTVEGDAVIVFHAAKGTKKPFNWECAIFDQDKTTILKSENIGKGYSYLAANDLTAGTYYVRVQVAQDNDPSVSPDRYGFTDNQYSVKALTCASPRPEVDKNGLMVVSEPATVLCVLDGSIFVKTDEEEAIVGLYTDHRGKTGPLLVKLETLNKNGGAYFTSKTDYAYSFDDDRYVSYGERFNVLRYYYSSPSGFADPLLPNLYRCGDGQKMSEERAVKELLNVHFGKDPDEGLGFLIFMDSPWFLVAIGGSVVLIAAVVILIWLYNRNLRRREPWRNRTSVPSSDTAPATSTDITWHDGNPWIADHGNAKDM